MKRTVVAASLCAALFFASFAHADTDNEASAAAAESLFQEGRKLMEAKRYAEACPKFLASHKIAPAIGTLLNLADCYEKNNQLASAWARFHEAIALAQRLGRANREQTARERAAKLEPRLIKLTITARDTDIEVKLDGTEIDPAALGTPIPVDVGKHTIEATAKNKKPFVQEIEITDKSKSPEFEIPPLEDEPEPPREKEAGNSNRREPRDEERSGWSTQKTVGAVTAGLGVVGLGVGGFFGLKTSSTWIEAQTHCNANLECDPQGVDLAAQAKNSGNISTIATLAGAALVLGGAVLFFTAPHDRSTGAARGVRVGVGPGSLTLGGKF